MQSSWHAACNIRHVAALQEERQAPETNMATSLSTPPGGSGPEPVVCPQSLPVFQPETWDRASTSLYPNYHWPRPSGPRRATVLKRLCTYTSREATPTAEYFPFIYTLVLVNGALEPPLEMILYNSDSVILRAWVDMLVCWLVGLLTFSFISQFSTPSAASILSSVLNCGQSDPCTLCSVSSQTVVLANRANLGKRVKAFHHGEQHSISSGPLHYPGIS